MSAQFQIIINGLQTTTVGELTNVVKRVDFTVQGTEEGQSFELPQSVDLGDPDAGNFTQLADLTEANVTAFVEGAFLNMPGVKSHIQYVLDKEVAKGRLTAAPLPWAPVPEPVTPPATPEGV